MITLPVVYLLALQILFGWTAGGQVIPGKCNRVGSIRGGLPSVSYALPVQESPQPSPPLMILETSLCMREMLTICQSL